MYYRPHFHERENHYNGIKPSNDKSRCKRKMCNDIFVRLQLVPKPKSIEFNEQPGFIPNKKFSPEIKSYFEKTFHFRYRF